MAMRQLEVAAVVDVEGANVAIDHAVHAVAGGASHAAPIPATSA